MIITHKSLPRRTVLRGAGVTMALPLLDAMVPALSARAAAAPAPRLGFFYVPNGMYLPSFHPAGEGGTNFEITPVLAPLAPYRQQMVVVSGLANKMADSVSDGGGAHERPHSSWLCGARAKKTGGADVQAGTTMDQIAARTLGQDTQLSSLELQVDSATSCFNGAGYSCVYVNTFVWRTPTQPVPMESNPRRVFERLFGDSGSAQARLEQLHTDKSILDWVTKGLSRLQTKLGPGDRLVVGQYLDSVRDVEKRIQQIEKHSATSLPTMEQPAGPPESYDEHAKLLFDLQFLAYQADITRVVTFQIARELSERTYPWVGVPESHHNMSHHQNNPERIQYNTKINAYHMSLFAGLVERMRNTADGDGTLLDHAMLLYGAGMGDGDLHSPHNVPVVIVGGGNGKLVGGRHIKTAFDTPMMNLGLSLLDKVGVELESLGDSTGRLTGL